jgi:hypothetical protein
VKEEGIQAYRLSPQQERVWKLQQGGGAQAYRCWSAILVEGCLDRKVLNEALQLLADRHEILRTNFLRLPEKSMPVQAVAEVSRPSLCYYDLSNFGPEGQEAIIEKLLQGAGYSAYNFEQGSLLHTSLMTLSRSSSILLVSLPALCADAVTLNNMLGEIARTYAALLGREELPERAFRYADFAWWQNEVLEAWRKQARRAYWQESSLRDLLCLKLALEDRSLAGAEFEPRSIGRVIPPEIKAKIDELAQRYDVTASVILQACWQTLLWHLAGQQDVVVGTGYDGRKYEQMRGALGLFARYLPIVCRLRGEAEINEVLRQVEKASDEAYKWQSYFSWEEIAPPSEQGAGEVFFPFCFDFEQQPADCHVGNTRFSIHQQYTCIDRFKIRLRCVESGDRLIAEIHYDPRSFSDDSLARLEEKFHTLLKNAVERPSTRIDEMEMLGPGERHRVVAGFNSAKTDYPISKRIHEMIH